jgi:hypothetical protein
MKAMKHFTAFAATLALIASALSLSAQGTGATERRIQWKAVEGSKSYLMEIRDPGSDDIILSRSVNGTSADVSLKPGDYEVRITALNKFLKPAGKSSWTKLSVKRSVAPDPKDMAGTDLYAGAKDQALTVSGSGFMASTEAYLEVDGKSVRAAVLGQTEGSISLSFDLTSAPPGEYALRFKNPSSNASP